MKKTNFTFVRPLRWVFVLAAALLSGNYASAQCTLACNDNVQVSVTPDNFVNSGQADPCTVAINADMILEGTASTPDLPCGAAFARIEIKRGNSLVHLSGDLLTIDEVTEFDGSFYLGQTLTTKISVFNAGGALLNACWGSIRIEDKSRPEFICPTAPFLLDCTEDPDDVPAPDAFDNCDPAPQVNLISEVVSGDECDVLTITRTYITVDQSGNESDPCTITILIDQPDVVEFPDDITWTCEQYLAYSNIIDAQPLHGCILENAAAMDLADYCCIPGLDGDDVVGVAPYQPLTSWWTDGEDLDVTLDPNYDDNIDNPLNDPVPGQCGTTTAETDSRADICNLSLFVGCPYMEECIIPGTHIPTVLDVPIYLPTDPAGLPVRGLEDADVLEATGSGVPSVLGTDCNFIVTYTDTRLEACTGIDPLTGPVFKILRNWTVLNWCTGQILTDIQVIKVVDKKAPEIVFNDDDNNNGVPDENQTNETYGSNDGFDDQLEANEIITVSGHSDCGSHGLLDVPEILDNCTGVVEIRAFTPAGEATPVYNGGTLIGFRIPSPYLSLGVHNITYKATDGCGNSATAVKRVEVIDGIPPVPICREVTQVALSSGVDGLTSVGAAYFDEGSYDNCAPVYFKVLKMVEGTCDDANRDKANETREWFDDDVKFCCSDIQYDANGNPLPIMVILRVYDVDPGPGAIPTVRSNPNNPNNLSHNGSASSLNQNHYNDCMIEVYVEDKTRPVCAPPHDVWTTCADIPANVDLSDTTVLQDLFGNASVLDNCGVNSQEISTTVDVDLCGVGQVIRNFRAVDASGNLSLGICRQVINIMQVTSYELDIPGDFEDECTDVSPDTLVYREFGCDLLAVNVEDQEFPASANGECKKIIRHYSIINWCEYDGFSAPTVLIRRDLNRDGMVGDGFTPSNPSSRFRSNYRVISNGDFIYLNSINDPVTRIAPSTGYYTYEQHIKIYDDTAPVLTDTLSGPFCGGELDEDPCTGFVDILPMIEEACTDVTITWQLDVNNDGSFDLNGSNAFQGRVELGNHRVRFRVADDCGNISQIDIPFEVIDCKAPTPVCHNGLSVDLMPTGMVEIWAVDFDASSFDYCHPIKFAINRIEDLNGDGVIDASDYQTTPPSMDSIVLRCKDLGITQVQLWVGEVTTDNVNNWDYCVTFIEVQDNFGACNGNRPSIAGGVQNETGDDVSNVKVDLSGTPTASFTTQNNGVFGFGGLVDGNDYSVTPSRDDDVRNGVSTFDLVQISKHILNVKFLDSPYKIIAADANNSRSITTLDLVALRKIILHVADELPNNTSWRFVDKGYSFPNPADPFQAQFPEVKNFNNISGNQTADFVAIKVGDVSGNARPNDLTGVDNRNFNGTLFFNVEDKEVKAGEQFEVEFTADDLASIQGYQFTLNFNNDVLELVDVIDGVAGEENFGMSQLDKGALTTSWNGEAKENKAFTLVFTARNTGNLSDLISISSEYTMAEAYGTDASLKNVGIQFGSGVVSTADFALYQNTPNPFKGVTTIGFNLPEATSATITVTDVAGKVLKVIKGEYAKGYNSIVLDGKDFSSNGVMYYQLETTEHTATRKMIIIE